MGHNVANESRCTNHLASETSPYLLQHARNPVDWYPWGHEAFDRARHEDKPIFLSIGYSSCHWCHVMERESFEHADVARILNDDFISVKVDREERPDLDAIFMAVTQMATGRGGWPNSVWLTPGGKPWYAGTYWPREDSPGRPGFKSILLSLAEIWRERRQEVMEQAEKWAAALKDRSKSGPGRIDRAMLHRAVHELTSAFDSQHGGFGGPPKFPPHSSLRLLLDAATRESDHEVVQMITRTLDAMSLGGMRDHLGGGFHRYSTDASWLVPHFEKMLYDNAQLAGIYARAHGLTGIKRYADVARETCEWVLREMTDAEGGFFSAIDADSEGLEGRYYVWTQGQVMEILGPGEGELFCRIYNVLPEGNFRNEATGRLTGANILHLVEPMDDLALVESMNPQELEYRMLRARAELLRARSRRIPPLKDDKVLCGWNGLMIGALAVCGRMLDEPRFIDAAKASADFVLGYMRRGDRLLRTWRGGRAKLGAYLDDYAFLANGLLDLHAATGETQRIEQATELLQTLSARYGNPDGGFYFTADDHEDLLLRQRAPFDQAVPNGNAMAALALLRLAEVTGQDEYSAAAERTVEAFAQTIEATPRATESMLLVAGRLLQSERVRAPRDEPLVTLHATPQPAFTTPGGHASYHVVLHVAPGWHVNAHEPLEPQLHPTALRIEETEGIELVEVHYPRGEPLETDGHPEPEAVYRGETELRALVSVASDADPGSRELTFTVNLQPCDDSRCLAPRLVQTNAELVVRESSNP